MGGKLRKFRNLTTRSQLAFIVLSLLSAGLGGRSATRGLLSLANEYLEEKSEKWEQERVKYQSLKNCLVKLKQAGLVNNETRGLWGITSQGESFIGKIQDDREESKPAIPQGPPNTIVIFDVPEKESGKRKSLRIQLALLGFRRLQKSVWLGHGPLPEKFIKYLSDIEVLSYIHIFSIKEAGTIAV